MNSKKSKPTPPQTSQDERAPQDENPVTSPSKSGNKSDKTLNDPVEKERSKSSDNGRVKK